MLADLQVIGEEVFLYGFKVATLTNEAPQSIRLVFRDCLNGDADSYERGYTAGYDAGYDAGVDRVANA